MTDVVQVEALLGELEAREGAEWALLVSRSGNFIAGKVPPGAHVPTFAANFAVLQGAAANASAELGGELRSVVVGLGNGDILVAAGGPRAIFIVKVGKGRDVGGLLERLPDYAARIAPHL